MSRAIRRRLAAAEDGFTLIELLVSITVLAVGVIGLVKSFDGARNLNTISERTIAMTHVAERHVEQLHDLPYDALAHATPLPTNGSGGNQWVCPSSTNYDWDQNGCSATVEPLVQAGTGITGFTSQQDWFDARTGARGTVHRFATWVDETCTGGCNAANGRDYKRITVVIRLANGRPRTPIVLQSYAYDSERTRVCAPVTGGSNVCG